MFLKRFKNVFKMFLIRFYNVSVMMF